VCRANALVLDRFNAVAVVLDHQLVRSMDSDAFRVISRSVGLSTRSQAGIPAGFMINIE
jgi:hypothetical protein